MRDALLAVELVRILIVSILSSGCAFTHQILEEALTYGQRGIILHLVRTSELFSEFSII